MRKRTHYNGIYTPELALQMFSTMFSEDVLNPEDLTESVMDCDILSESDELNESS